MIVQFRLNKDFGKVLENLVSNQFLGLEVLGQDE